MRRPRSPRRSTLAWVLLVGALVLGVAGMHTVAEGCEPSAAAPWTTSHHDGTTSGSASGSHDGASGAGMLGACLAVLTAAAVLLLVLTARRPGRGWVPRSSVVPVVRPPGSRLPRPPDLFVLSVQRC